jgi:hypothetical protein
MFAATISGKALFAFAYYSALASWSAVAMTPLLENRGLATALQEASEFPQIFCSFIRCWAFDGRCFPGGGSLKAACR